jgi:hypothetical protein
MSNVVYCCECDTPICTNCEDHEVISLPNRDIYQCAECHAEDPL